MAGVAGNGKIVKIHLSISQSNNVTVKSTLFAIYLFFMHGMFEEKLEDDIHYRRLAIYSQRGNMSTQVYKKMENTFLVQTCLQYV